MPFIFDSVWIESKSHKLFELFSTLKSYRSEDVQRTSSKYARVRTKNTQSDATFQSNKSNVSYINRWSFQFPLRVWHKLPKILLNPIFKHTKLIVTSQWRPAGGRRQCLKYTREIQTLNFRDPCLIVQNLKFHTLECLFLRHCNSFFWGYTHLCRFGWKILLESPLNPCWFSLRLTILH